jgi:hypothetical protein
VLKKLTGFVKSDFQVLKIDDPWIAKKRPVLPVLTKNTSLFSHTEKNPRQPPCWAHNYLF